MKPPILFVTGTDTGIGKTVLTCWLARELRSGKLPVAALKPVCSGGREDAEALSRAGGNVLSLDETNPWHFRDPLTPVLAARRERRKVFLDEVLRFIRGVHNRFPQVIVEGAGGLLSPLGEDFDSRDLIVALRAVPVVVCPNRLGAINQTRLVLEAIPKSLSRQARVVLMSCSHPDGASDSNPRLLSELIGPDRVGLFPWIRNSPENADAPDARARRASRGILRSIGALNSL